MESSNISDTLFASQFEHLTSIPPTTILRLTIIVGGYLIIRPLIDAFFRRLMFSASENPSQPSSGDDSIFSKTLADEAVYSPIVDESLIDGEKEPQFDEWGNGARRTQARFMEYWEAEQVRRAEEEDLADIEDLLA